jgi:hypothetical protein
MRIKTAYGAFVLASFFVTAVPLFSATYPYSRTEPCPIDELVEDARRVAADMPVVHSNDLASYTEVFTYPGGSRKRVRSDFRIRSIPIVFLNTFTCELRASTLTRRIEHGVAPVLMQTDDGAFSVIIEPRAYGTIWNWWNTPFQVFMPDEGWIVLALHWKRQPSGESVVYTPGTMDLQVLFPSLIDVGKEHFRNDLRSAYLRLGDTASKGVPGMHVADVMTTYFPKLLESIAIIEHVDDHEAALHLENKAPINPIERVFLILGANPATGFSVTASPAGARGLMQVMPKTCASIRQMYHADIPAGCTEKPHSHPVEIASAALVVDYHLSVLYTRLHRKDETPEQFAARPDAMLMLRAAYNAGPGRVTNVVRNKKVWVIALLAETRGYLAKALGLEELQK